jgi:hypothetical protein
MPVKKFTVHSRSAEISNLNNLGIFLKVTQQKLAVKYEIFFGLKSFGFHQISYRFVSYNNEIFRSARISQLPIPCLRTIYTSDFKLRFHIKLAHLR